jgi:alanine racemase
VIAACRIDLDAIRNNVANLASRAPSAAVMAVVKADGYGHGMVPAARAALDGGASWLGVAVLAEAFGLRAAGIAAPVLAWLIGPDEELTDAIRQQIDVGVYAEPGLAAAAAAAHEVGAPARVHLKVDTGLSRGGATAADWPGLLDAAAKAAADRTVEVVGIWSHFAYADAPGHPTIGRQITRFTEAVEVAERAGVRPQLRHLANSAATLTLPAAHFDLVRPGIAAYGVSPGPDVGTPADFGLRPAMTLTGQVVLAKRVAAGEGVSYGHRYTTPRDTRLALVPLGYADGIPRAASSTGEVLLGGRRRRIAGTVCMDQVVFDVEDDPVTAGDEAVFFGPGDAGEPTAQEWAQALGTIGYEIVTRIGPRVPRVYTGGRK